MRDVGLEKIAEKGGGYLLEVKGDMLHVVRYPRSQLAVNCGTHSSKL